ncbi:MAG TPA: CocE/NonD family hydrolase [Bryobacteraceae bacterium]|nr:CocE/NonD family hydrolase [Bryobacteraceae bacterium]
MRKGWLLIWCVAACCAAARDDEDAKRKERAAYVRANYTKYDYRIAMRDGMKLFTSVYVPKDRTQSYPILLRRTPYSIGPYGVDNYPEELGPSFSFTKEGFIFAYQDVRGRHLSEGTFTDIAPHKPRLEGPQDTDDSTDSYDTVDWLVKNIPGNNGKAGAWGISYDGFYAAFTLIHAHPALKAVSPQAPVADIANGDDAYHNGAFYLAANFGFYTFFKPRTGAPARPKQGEEFDFGTPDQYDFFLKMGPLENADKLYLKNQNPYWEHEVEHPTYDEFWRSRGLAQYMTGVTPATLFVGGWFDAEDLAGPQKLFRAVEQNGPQAANTLVFGPWRHGGWAWSDGDELGNLKFGSKTGEYFREQIELPFFVQNLKDKGEGLKGKDAGVPKAIVFETGANQWRRFEAWPPKNARMLTLRLDARGKLRFELPVETGWDEYVSDPTRPVPVTGEIGHGMPGDYMTRDQRFAARRPDVLVYQSEPLEHDMTLAGPVTAALKVATTGTDSDFVVKLIDVYPSDYPNPDPNPAQIHMGGYQQMVRAEPFRGKYRNSLEKPQAFTPGQPAKIEFTMPDVCHTFRPGHRIMVQIQSSWFPMVDRNPQKFVEIPKAKESDFEKATERVYRGGAEGSALRVMALE